MLLYGTAVSIGLLRSLYECLMLQGLLRVVV